MKISRIGIVSVFIILLSVSCRSGEDMSAYFDEGRIENNTYISDSTGWKMMIPDGWKLGLKMNSEENKQIDKIYDNAGVSISPKSSITQLISLEKDNYNMFSANYGIAEHVNEDELRKVITIGKELLPDTFVASIEIITIGPIRKEVIDNVNFLTYNFECLLPPPINKKMYGVSFLGIVNDYYFSVSVNCTDLENRKEIMDAWFNSTFDKSKWKSIR